MHSVAEVVVWAVSQFWKHHKGKCTEADASSERMLRQILMNPEDRSAKIWAAVILHALRSDPARLPDVHAALLTAVHGTLGGPPEELLRHVGFIVHRNEVVPWGNVAQLPTSVANQSTLQHVLQLDFLNHQARGEICLALAGDKVSRLHLRGNDVRRLSDLLAYPVLVGARRVESVVDEALGEFSNIATRGGHMVQLQDHDPVYVYFGGSLEDRLLVSVLDALDSAGKYLGIPECCRMSFRISWREACRIHEGDVAFTLIADHCARFGVTSLAFPWQCNPYGMYQGGGVLWHFPCSLDCPESIRVVNARIETLRCIDASFAEETRIFQARAFWLTADRQVSLREPVEKAYRVVPQP